MLLIFVEALLANLVTNEIGPLHFGDLLPLGITYFFAFFFYAFYPHGPFLATILLPTYERYRSVLRFSRVSTKRNIVVGVLMGALVGMIFGVLVVLLAKLTRSTQFVEFVTGNTMDRLDYSAELQISICTGAANGALIAIMNQWSRLGRSVAAAPIATGVGSTVAHDVR